MSVSYIDSMAKVMVSIPDELLVEIDAEAARRSTSRSALLAAAARRELSRPRSAEMMAIIEESRRRFERAGPFDSADLIRAERDRRW